MTTSTTTPDTTLVVGSTGATGRHVVQMLLDQGQKVRTVVRSKARMEQLLSGTFEDRLEIIEASILDLDESNLVELTTGCYAVVSCLGHNPDLKGIWGEPRKLVTNAVEHFTTAINASGNPKTKFILMGSNGVANPNGNDDVRPYSERLLLSLLRFLVPPVSDNEEAALYLHNLGDKTCVEWCVVRPDDLIDGVVSNYELTPKPPFGLFGAGVSTRANVAHAMVQLVLDNDMWQKWKFQMPSLNRAVAEKEES